MTTNSEWIDEIDIIIRSNIDAIGKIFGEMKLKVDGMPIETDNLVEQLAVSERLVKEICIGFIAQMLKWIRKEFNIPRHDDVINRAIQMNALEESLNLD